MRRVVVTTSFPRHAGDAAGCFVEADARALVADEVHVLCPRGAPRDGLVVHGVGGGMLFDWPGAQARLREAPWRMVGALAFARGVRAALAALRPFDGVVAHWLLPSALLCAGYPLERAVAHGADVRMLVAMPAPGRAALVRALLQSRARFQFVAQALLDALLGVLPRELRRKLAARSFVEPCPLALPALDAATRARARAMAPYVVACGRLVPDKRMHLAIAAAKEIGLPIVVIGDGPSRKTLANGRAIFTGQLPRAQALAFVAEASALVSCSRHEAAPTVVREARSLGVPVVTTPSGDLARWAERDPGIVVVPQHEIARGLLGVASHDARSRPA